MSDVLTESRPPGPNNPTGRATGSTAALFVVADISGYTRFMQRHSPAGSHAREITVRLLKALARAAGPSLRLAEVEGDAVFLYAPTRPDELSGISRDFKESLVRLFLAFRREVDLLAKMDVCDCEACATVGQLKLKQVVHAGEATIEHVSRFEKLFGLDVIVVHRLLKNTVPAGMYLMMTTPARDVLGDFYGLATESRSERLADIGPVDVHVVYEAEIAEYLESSGAQADLPSLLQRAVWKVRLLARTVLDRLKVMIRAASFLVVSAVLVSCLSGPGEADELKNPVTTDPPNASTVADDSTYLVTGIIRSVTPSRSHIVVEHQDIPGFMEAMTMPFAVRDTALLSGVQTGDSIHFRIAVTSSGVFADSVLYVRR